MSSITKLTNDTSTMNTNAAWKRSSEMIVQYLEATTTLATSEKAGEVARLFENIHLLFPQWAILTCPVMHPHIRYASENCFEVFGHSMDYMTQHNQVEKFFSYVHDDDQEDVYKCYAYFYNYLGGIPSEEHQDVRAAIYYRFRSAKGQYIHLNDEKAALSLHGGGNFYYALFQNISDCRPFTGVRVEIFRRSLQMKRIVECKPSAKHIIRSKREGELVSLIRQGLSTKEIAHYLKISPNTVRNLKSKLFEKYGASNSIELLNMTA